MTINNNNTKPCLEQSTKKSRMIVYLRTHKHISGLNKSDSKEKHSHTPKHYRNRKLTLIHPASVIVVHHTYMRINIVMLSSNALQAVMCESVAQNNIYYQLSGTFGGNFTT